MDHFALDFDFEMLPETAPTTGNATDVVAVHLGHRVVSATVYWRATGDVFISMEGTAGLDLDHARGVIANALRDALDEIPALPEYPERPAQGPQFYAGRGFARRLARALRSGNASVINAA